MKTKSLPKSRHRTVLDFFETNDEKGIIRMVQQGVVAPDDSIPGVVPGDKFKLLPAAIKRGWTDLATWLIQNGANVNGYSVSATPLMLACFRQNHEVIEALLKAGADPNLKARRIEDSSGETALMVAAEQHDTWAVIHLLKAGADPKVMTHRKQTAVYSGVRPRAVPETAKVVRELVAAGCPLLGNELHYPIYRREVTISTLLLKCGCPPNALFDQSEGMGPDRGETPLTIAVSTNTEDEIPLSHGVPSTLPLRLQLVEALLASGADPDLANARGRTPLMQTVLEDAPQLAGLLLRAGADPNFVPPKSRAESPAVLVAKSKSRRLTSLFGLGPPRRSRR